MTEEVSGVRDKGGNDHESQHQITKESLELVKVKKKREIYQQDMKGNVSKLWSLCLEQK